MHRPIFLHIALALVLALALPLSGCSITAPDGSASGTVTREGDIVSGTGTVAYFDLEGGFFAIRGDDAKTYDPVNLPEQFRQNGLRVRFRAKIRGDLVSFHMVGPLVEILAIERL